MNETLPKIFDTEYEYLRHNLIDNTITVLSNDIESHVLWRYLGVVYDESEVTRDIYNDSIAQLLHIQENTAVHTVDIQIQQINKPQEIHSNYTSERNIDPHFACTQGAHTAVAFSLAERTVHGSVFYPDRVRHDFLFPEPSSEGR